MKRALHLTLCTTLLAAGSAVAGGPEDAAARAAAERRSAYTVFVDVHFGAREDGAAKALNRAHQAFERHGYELVDVSPYTENGDLQGFFVSYRRPSPAPVAR